MRRKEETAGLWVEDPDEIGAFRGNDVMSSRKRMSGHRKYEWNVDHDVSGLGLPDCGTRCRKQGRAQHDAKELHDSSFAKLTMNRKAPESPIELMSTYLA